MLKKYSNEFLGKISFPLGGIGTGSIGLAGNGLPVDCEIMNRPNRNTVFGCSHFAIKAEDENSVIDSRLLCGDDYNNLMGTDAHYGQGTSCPLSGCKHFNNVDFIGEYPVATINFSDDAFPGTAEMQAFNPFIPSNEHDSGIPAAFFEIKLKNTTDRKLKYTIALSVDNPFENKGLHILTENGLFTGVKMNSSAVKKSALSYGNILLSTQSKENASFQQYWFRGNWFDSLTMFLNDFSSFGSLKNRIYDTPYIRGATSTVASSVEIQPGSTDFVRFLIAWYVPNFASYWSKPIKRYRNYYSTIFSDSSDVTEYCYKNWNRLYEQTIRFKNALFSSSLPEDVIDAIQGNIATLKSTTCLRLEDGSLWSFEGVTKSKGLCHGTCQHVWNYSYALAFLFPKLEKGIRSNELDYCFEESGMLHFRMNIDKSFWWKRACVDGQMGTIMKIYREWKLSGDIAWLKKYWNKIKKSMEYAWSPENNDKWDTDKSGVITGIQHHTLDTELYGCYAWLTGMYHGALLAAAEMAAALGDSAAAKEYTAIYDRGHAILESQTFNGEYYVQNIDLSNKDTIEKFGSVDVKYYWNTESNQMKYQIADGCEIDQVLADWHADLIGFKHVFDQNHRKSALKAIYKNNYKSMRSFTNPCRTFACNDEAGVVMCTWPEKAKKPDIPIPYAEECMTGFEYAVACNMLQVGMEKESLEIVKSIRQRYDGKKRNPWAEIECGANYIRAMASYSFLLAYSGFRYNLANGMIGFNPIHDGTYFWSVDGAWGTADIEKSRIIIRLLYGELKLQRFETDFTVCKKVIINDNLVNFDLEDGAVALDCCLRENDCLSFYFD